MPIGLLIKIRSEGSQNSTFLVEWHHIATARTLRVFPMEPGGRAYYGACILWWPAVITFGLCDALLVAAPTLSDCHYFLLAKFWQDFNKTWLNVVSDAEGRFVQNPTAFASASAIQLVPTLN